MITFRLFAGTNIGLRDNNEDNFTVCRDLTHNDWIVPVNQQETIQLGERGCLAVVADGMGGQNAGEVASATAIETVQKLFAPDVMPVNTIEKPERIISYLKKVIVQADLRIKQRSANDSAVEGMGSTIVIVWLVGGNAYVGWMGDSRAYSYIPNKGIARITKDHSYVQQLVDANLLSEEQAMNDPNSNIIMRSLGDASQKAKPDVVCHPITEGEIILLCTDGLCGVCTDKEIETVITEEKSDIYNCKERLTEAAIKSGGSDNITIALFQIVGLSNDTNFDETLTSSKARIIKRNKILSICVVFMIIIVSFFGGVYVSKCNSNRIMMSNDSDSVALTKQVQEEMEQQRCINIDTVEVNIKNTVESKKMRSELRREEIVSKSDTDNVTPSEVSDSKTTISDAKY